MHCLSKSCSRRGAACICFIALPEELEGDAAPRVYSKHQAAVVSTCSRVGQATALHCSLAGS